MVALIPDLDAKAQHPDFACFPPPCAGSEQARNVRRVIADDLPDPTNFANFDGGLVVESVSEPGRSRASILYSALFRTFARSESTLRSRDVKERRQPRNHTVERAR